MSRYALKRADASLSIPVKNGFVLGRASVDEFREVMRISGKHLKLHVKKDGIYVEDLGSTNFTFVNSEQLPPGEKRKLEIGDIVSLAGEEELYLVPEDAGSEAAAETDPHAGIKFDNSGVYRDPSKSDKVKVAAFAFICVAFLLGAYAFYAKEKERQARGRTVVREVATATKPQAKEDERKLLIEAIDHYTNRVAMVMAKGPNGRDYEKINKSIEDEFLPGLHGMRDWIQELQKRYPGDLGLKHAYDGLGHFEVVLRLMQHQTNRDVANEEDGQLLRVRDRLAAKDLKKAKEYLSQPYK